MTKAGDLAPLLVKQANRFGMRQGVVSYFDSGTGSNQVLMDGQYINDLPLLNTADAVNIAVGDVVALLRYKSTYFILGRIVTPGSAFAPTSVAFAQVADTATDFPIHVAGDVLCSGTAPVPGWANRAALTVNFSVSFQDTGGTGDNLFINIGAGDTLGHQDSILYGGEAVTGLDAGKTENIAQSHQRIIDNPLSPIKVVGHARTQNALRGGSILDIATLTALIIYQRVPGI